MSYDPNIPLATDIPRDSQEEIVTNFGKINDIYGENHIPFGNSIVSASSEAVCRLECTAHRFRTGDTVVIDSLKGTNSEGQERDWSINGNNYTLTLDVTDPVNFFTIPVNTSTENAYIADTGNAFISATSGAVPFYGLHKLINFFSNINDPGLATPKSSIYSKEVDRWVYVEEESGTKLNLIKGNDLFFQNNTDTSLRMTGNAIKANYDNGPVPPPPDLQISGFRTSIVTPWGLTINMGYFESINAGISPKIVLLDTAYTTRHYFTVAINVVIGSPVRVPITSLTSFNATVKPSQNSVEIFNWLSMGV